MVNIFNRIFRRWGQSVITNLLVDNYTNTVIWPDTEGFDTFTDNYTSNGDVFTVINKIIEPASRVPIMHIDKNGKEKEKSRTLELIQNPAPFMSLADFIEAGIASYMLYGNTYLNALKAENGLNAGKPVRLEYLPPPYTTIKIGTRLEPIQGYVLTYLGRNTLFEIQDVMHWKEYNPDWGSNFGAYGMSRLKPIIKSVAASDSAYQSMVSAFKNQGAYGILTVLGVKDDDGKLTQRSTTKQQLSALKNQFKPGGNMVGDTNRGKIAATSKSVEWTPLGLSPIDLKILDSLGVTRGVIADAYNVPNQLLSGSRDRTYNNYQEAARSLWTNGIMPMLDGYLEILSQWLIPQFGEDGTLIADYNNVEVLQKNKKELIEWMVRANSFSRNEIRAAAGADPRTEPEMDKIYISMAEVPIDEQMPKMEDTEKFLTFDYRENQS